MSPWKVILATLAIFITGLISGAVLVRFSPQPGMMGRANVLNQPSLQPGPLRDEFVHRMERELSLTPEQREKIIGIVHESQERTKLLYSLIGEDIREEMRETRESIRQQLRPDQARKFEEMLRQRPRRLATLRGEEPDEPQRSWPVNRPRGAPGPRGAPPGEPPPARPLP